MMFDQATVLIAAAATLLCFLVVFADASGP
jgi:hypothetical protein